MGLGERVRAEREARRWSKKRLGREAYISDTWVADIERGVEPRPIVVRSLAVVFDVNEQWLATGEGEKRAQGQLAPLDAATRALLADWRLLDTKGQAAVQALLEALRGSGAKRETPTNVVDFAAARRARAADGDPDQKPITLRLVGYVAAGEPIAAVRLDDEIEVPARCDGAGRFCLKVRGDSMTGAGIPDGAVVCCEPAAGYRWRRGDYVIAQVDDHGEPAATLKRYVKSKRGTVYLAPENPEHEVQSYGPGQWTIQARVVAVRIGDDWEEVGR